MELEILLEEIHVYTMVCNNQATHNPLIGQSKNLTAIRRPNDHPIDAKKNLEFPIDLTVQR